MHHLITPKILKEIKIDFSRDMLYGWQREYDPLIIELMKISIAKGIEFPPVDVVQTREREYHIAYFFDENRKISGGGHHRARLGFELGHLSCYLREFHDEEFKAKEFFPIQNINPISDEERIRRRYLRYKFQKSLTYLSPNETEEFCIKHGLNPKYWNIEEIIKTIPQKTKI